VIAAGLKEECRGPVFIQGDHYQVNAKKFAADSALEVDGLKKLISDSIVSGFYNIDIDSSTLVDLNKPTIEEQQRPNFEVAAELTAYIREQEPVGITVSVGGEIGEVGGKNSTLEEFRAYMDNYLTCLKEKGNYRGISKISVQTGTSHGGTPMADGKIAEVKLDFGVLDTISSIARSDYGISGTVQHGASTLPEDAFDKFPQHNASEVHLATGFQNMIYNNSRFPSDFREEIFSSLRERFISEKKESDTDEQFIYKTRKKGFGVPFKEKFWDLPLPVRENIEKELEDKFDFLFSKLNVVNTFDAVSSAITVPDTLTFDLQREIEMSG